MKKIEMTLEIVNASNISERRKEEAIKRMLKHNKEALEAAYSAYIRGGVTANQVITCYTQFVPFNCND